MTIAITVTQHRASRGAEHGHGDDQGGDQPSQRSHAARVDGEQLALGGWIHDVIPSSPAADPRAAGLSDRGARRADEWATRKERWARRAGSTWEIVPGGRRSSCASASRAAMCALAAQVPRIDGAWGR